MLRQLLFIVCLLCINQVFAQKNVFVLSANKLTDNSSANLSDQSSWRFHLGYDSSWANPGFDDTKWRRLNPKGLSMKEADRNGLIEGCFRFRLTMDSSLTYEAIYLRLWHYALVRVFINGHEQLTRDHTGQFIPMFQPIFENSIPQRVDLDPTHTNAIVLYVRDQKVNWLRKYTYLDLANPLEVSIGNATGKAIWARAIQLYKVTNSVNIAGLILLALLFWLLVGQNPAEKQLLRIALITTLLALDRIINGFGQDTMTFLTYPVHFHLWGLVSIVWVSMIPLVVSQIILNTTGPVVKGFFCTGISLRFLLSFFSEIPLVDPTTIYIGAVFSLFIIGYVLFLIWKYRTRLDRAQWVAVIGLLLSFLFGFTSTLINPTLASPSFFYTTIATFLTFPASLLVYVSLRIKENIITIQKNALAITQLSQEKQQILTDQNELLEQQVKARTAELKASQSQLIQKEKLASLGELTAGIAHEIQNPLNFVNNFSEVSTELVDELKEGPFQKLPDTEKEYAEEILSDLTQNLTKITRHGQRASSIVKGMLEHSRVPSGERQLTDLNQLADEYLRLSYHGLRAKNNGLDSDHRMADYELIVDENLPLVSVVPQEIGRVLLNLINNAFYAVNERFRSYSRAGDAHDKGMYQPKVVVSIKVVNNQIVIQVQDNGAGIPDAIVDKIFQPFFTTKPTGEGTGLGLSLSYDIITKGYGGTIELESTEGEGTTFTITLKNN